MFKIMGLALVATFLLLPESEQQHATFSKYKTIQAYEVRPGILMMPTFSTDGELCEVGLEKLHYTPEMVVLSPELSRDQIRQIFDELAPGNERGSRPANLLERGTIEQEGDALVENDVYENVSLHIYSEASRVSKHGATVVTDVAATIDWKRPGCK